MATRTFELLLFSADPALIRAGIEGGVGGVVIDWDRRGKPARQAGADTQINRHTVDDLRRARSLSAAGYVICRTNPVGKDTVVEIGAALAAGADEILLPMVRSPLEVERVLDLVDDRCPVGVMLETAEAVAQAQAIARMPLRRVYVGLNDLVIQRGAANVFVPVADGTVERLRRIFPQPFGFGGVTLPERGAPIPCALIIGELARIGCDFSVLRRSFCADAAGRDAAAEIRRIRAAVETALRRPPDVVAREHAEFRRRVAEWKPRRD